ncbi:6-bladed beta-propeller [uncultured Sunxiuqinia sp.]|uniref:6-bladed beta-propeller n=1 Tax=uncultured Sunxiuqinia sp. TaxID=1573825 RepID=UPI002636E789|nr:6-bladed beta-propeller [uncultured Sunxiuqinia sp.]
MSNYKKAIAQFPVLFTVCLMLLNSSCNNSKTNQLKTIIPDFSSEPSVELTDVASQISYLPLNDSILLEDIYKLKSSESLLFMQSEEGSVNVFNLEGKFVNRVGKLGEGPGEVSNLVDYAIDKSAKRIYILNRFKLLMYDFSGNFIKAINLPIEEHFQNMSFLNNQIYLFDSFDFGKLKYNWFIVDSSGQEKGHKLNTVEPFQSSMSLTNKTYFEDQSETYYWNYLNDTVFSMGLSNHQPQFIFAQTNERVKPTDLIDPPSFMQMNAFLLTSILKNGRFLVLDYISTKRQKKVMGIYDCTKESYHVASNTDSRSNNYGLPNNWDGGLPFSPKAKVSLEAGEFLVSWIHAYQLKARVASNAFKNATPLYPEKKKELEKLANSLDENDNPVLMLVKLKE